MRRIRVVKADGSEQEFSREKVLRTCNRMRLSRSEANDVVNEIEGRLYDGIPTARIIQMILEHGKRHVPHFANIVDLREALSLMRPKPDFEQYVAAILESRGYKVFTNKFLRGRCVEHEIDVIAVRGSETIYVEVKHHGQFHTFTGLDTLLEINSVYDDLKDGFKAGRQKYAVNKAMLVCNTKISNHARDYSSCRGIDVLAWETPQHAGIEDYIHQTLIYPVTMLKMDMPVQYRLADNGIYTMKALVQAGPEKVAKMAGVSVKEAEEMVSKAQEVLKH